MGCSWKVNTRGYPTQFLHVPTQNAIVPIDNPCMGFLDMVCHSLLSLVLSPHHAQLFGPSDWHVRTPHRCTPNNIASYNTSAQPPHPPNKKNAFREYKEDKDKKKSKEAI